jgi:hypothetical protein
MKHLSRKASVNCFCRASITVLTAATFISATHAQQPIMRDAPSRANTSGLPPMPGMTASIESLNPQPLPPKELPKPQRTPWPTPTTTPPTTPLSLRPGALSASPNTALKDRAQSIQAVSKILTPADAQQALKLPSDARLQDAEGRQISAGEFQRLQSRAAKQIKKPAFIGQTIRGGSPNPAPPGLAAKKLGQKRLANTNNLRVIPASVDQAKCRTAQNAYGNPQFLAPTNGAIEVNYPCVWELLDEVRLITAGGVAAQRLQKSVNGRDVIKGFDNFLRINHELITLPDGQLFDVQVALLDGSTLTDTGYTFRARPGFSVSAIDITQDFLKYVRVAYGAWNNAERNGAFETITPSNRTVFRAMGGATQVCFTPGEDRFELIGHRKGASGFGLIEIETDRRPAGGLDDDGKPGLKENVGTYQIRNPGNGEFRIKWGVHRSYTAPNFDPRDPGPGFDTCSSWYTLKQVWAVLPP